MKATIVINDNINRGDYSKSFILKMHKMGAKISVYDDKNDNIIHLKGKKEMKRFNEICLEMIEGDKVVVSNMGHKLSGKIVKLFEKKISVSWNDGVESLERIKDYKYDKDKKYWIHK